MTGGTRIIAIVGALGIFPMTRLSVPARRILAYLAIRGRPIARAHAAADLWPDVPEEASRANLRRALWITPAACGAVAPIGIVQARTSFTPAVKYVCRFSSA